MASLFERARGNADTGFPATWQEPTPVLRRRRRGGALPWLLALLGLSTTVTAFAIRLEERQLERARLEQALDDLQESRRLRTRLEGRHAALGDQLTQERDAVQNARTASEHQRKASADALVAALKEPLGPEPAALVADPAGTAVLTIPMDALFGEGADPSLAGMRLLHRVAKGVQAAPGRRTRIDARFDPKLMGDRPGGLAATAARATSVLTFLRDEAGVDAATLSLSIAPREPAAPRRGKVRPVKPALQLHISP